jgi:hypothetical protein
MQEPLLKKSYFFALLKDNLPILVLNFVQEGCDSFRNTLTLPLFLCVLSGSVFSVITVIALFRQEHSISFPRSYVFRLRILGADLDLEKGHQYQAPRAKGFAWGHCRFVTLQNVKTITIAKGVKKA